MRERWQCQLCGVSAAHNTTCPNQDLANETFIGVTKGTLGKLKVLCLKKGSSSVNRRYKKVELYWDPSPKKGKREKSETVALPTVAPARRTTPPAPTKLLQTKR